MIRFLPKIKILLVILFSAASVQWGYSQALLVENFDYPASTLLTSVGWTAHSGAGSQSIDVIVPGLTFTGYPLSDIGGAANLDNTGEDVNKTFTSQTTGAVYVAFMVKVNTVVAGYFLHLGQSNIGTTFFARVSIAPGTGSDFKFGLAKSTETALLTSTEYSPGTTYFAVLKYNIVDGTVNDEVSLFIFDGTIPTSEPATATIPAFTTTAADYSPGSIALRQYSASQNINVDGIRVGRTWSEAVTDIPGSDVAAPLFTDGFPKVANIDETQADLQVSMDEAGKAYYVVVPDGATAPTATEVFAGTNYGTVTLTAAGTIDVIAAGATYSATITGLTDKTNYDIYIIAEDDEATPNQQTTPVIVNLFTIRPPDVLLNATFETEGSLAPFTQVSITGDQVWGQAFYSGNGYAIINGYSGGAVENADWLISPSINLDASEMNKVSFTTAKNYTGADLRVMISADFSGTFTPADITAATWTDITSDFSFSTTSFTWVQSGEFSLESYAGNIYIAFVYESSTTAAATWEVDNFKVTGYLLPGSDATLSDLKVDGVTITDFDPATFDYKVDLDAGVTVVPEIVYTTTDPAATSDVTVATDLSGAAAARTTTIVVTAADGVTQNTYKVLFNPVIAVADIAALRAVAEPDYDRIYRVTGEVVITGLNPSQRGQKYAQDASAGVLIDDAAGVMTTVYNIGDGITGLTGTLLNYYDMLEFVPTADPGTASTTGNNVAIQTVTVSEFKANFESYEAELVKITGLDFTVADGTATFETKKNYDVTAGTDATVVRTVFLTSDLTGAIIPNMADVTGVAVWDFSAAKIAPRNLADLNIYSSVATLSDLKVNGTTVTGFTSATLTYNVSLPAGTTVVPAITATATEANATVVVTAATSLTGDASARTSKVDVTSHDKSATKQYTVVFTVATGVDDVKAGRVRLYPVPAHADIFAENLSDVTMIEIFDITGNKHITETCSGQDHIRIPVSQLSRGVYFIRFITPQGTFMKRFIKD